MPGVFGIIYDSKNLHGREKKKNREERKEGK